MKKIDFFKKGYIDFFLNYFIAFSKVQSDIFTDKSHSTLKRNPKVSLEGRGLQCQGISMTQPNALSTEMEIETNFAA